MEKGNVGGHHCGALALRTVDRDKVPAQASHTRYTRRAWRVLGMPTKPRNRTHQRWGTLPLRFLYEVADAMTSASWYCVVFFCCEPPPTLARSSKTVRGGGSARISRLPCKKRKKREEIGRLGLGRNLRASVATETNNVSGFGAGRCSQVPLGARRLRRPGGGRRLSLFLPRCC